MNCLEVALSQGLGKGKREKSDFGDNNAVQNPQMEISAWESKGGATNCVGAADSTIRKQRKGRSMTISIKFRLGRGTPVTALESWQGSP